MFLGSPDDVVHSGESVLELLYKSLFSLEAEFFFAFDFFKKSNELVFKVALLIFLIAQAELLFVLQLPLK